MVGENNLQVAGRCCRKGATSGGCRAIPITCCGEGKGRAGENGDRDQETSHCAHASWKAIYPTPEVVIRSAAMMSLAVTVVEVKSVKVVLWSTVRVEIATPLVLIELLPMVGIAVPDRKSVV